MKETGSGHLTEIPFISNTFTDGIGLAVYAFEGIGLVIPVYDITENKKMYPKIVIACILTCCSTFIWFSLFCIGAWGKDLDSPLVTDRLPQGPITYIIKIFFMFMLIVSYPLQMYPVHIIIENILYDGWPKSMKRQWSKNFSRSLLVLVSCLFTKALGNKLDKFLSILGAVSCTPVAFTFPVLFHLKACAKTRKDKIVDISILVISIIIFFYCTTMSTIGFFQDDAPSE